MSILIYTHDSFSDDSWVSFMESFKRVLCNSSSYSSSKEHAHISNEISTKEHFWAVLLVILINSKFPVIG